MFIEFSNIIYLKQKKQVHNKLPNNEKRKGHATEHTQAYLSATSFGSLAVKQKILWIFCNYLCRKISAKNARKSKLTQTHTSMYVCLYTLFIASAIQRPPAAVNALPPICGGKLPRNKWLYALNQQKRCYKKPQQHQQQPLHKHIYVYACRYTYIRLYIYMYICIYNNS